MNATVSPVTHKPVEDINEVFSLSSTHDTWVIRSKISNLEILTINIPVDPEAKASLIRQIHTLCRQAISLSPEAAKEFFRTHLVTLEPNLENKLVPVCS